MAECSLDRRLCLIAGRQIETTEDLEILALITESQFEHGHPQEESIDFVQQTASLPVILWGFGKWMDARGRLLKCTSERIATEDLFVRDNYGRPVFWGSPFHFKIEDAKGIRILPGSNPLPLPPQASQPGSFGF